MRSFFLLLCALWLLPASASNSNLLGNLLQQPAEHTFLPVDQAFVFDF